MIYEKIQPDVVIRQIEKIFDNSSHKESLYLSPDSISEFAELSGVHLKWRPILNWVECFEFNTYEYADQDFLEIAFAKVNPSEGQTIIFTHECLFTDCMAFSVFHFRDMVHFMEVIYPDLFNIQFAQPSDFIFIQPDIDLITMIHHEGWRTKYARPISHNPVPGRKIVCN